MFRESMRSGGRRVFRSKRESPRPISGTCGVGTSRPFQRRRGRMKPAIAFCLFAAPLAFTQDLATRLAAPELRDVAVKEVAAAGGKDLLLLLNWSETPPKGIAEWELRVGLADAFEALRAKDAIPFLIKNVGLERYFVRQ